MKKKRILSLLLAAIMTATSLPIVATSVSAATVEPTADENLLDLNDVEVSTNANQRERDKNVNNGYLHVGARTAPQFGLGVYFETEFKNGETYFLSFDLRSAVVNERNSTGTWQGGRMELCVGGNVVQLSRGSDFKYWELSRLKTYGLGRTDNTTNINNDGSNPYAVMVADSYTKTTTSYHTVNDHNSTLVAVMSTDYYSGSEWLNYEIMLPNVKADEANAYISFVGSADAGNDAAPFEIDNIRLYQREGNVRTGDYGKYVGETFTKGELLEEYKFDDAATGLPSFFVANGFSGPASESNKASVEWVSSTKAFIEAYFNTTNKPTDPTYVTYTPKTATTLEAGIYELSGEFRDGWQTKKYNSSFDNSSMKLTPTINVVGDGDIILAQAQLCTEWTPVTYRFVISAETTLENVTFASSVNETLQFRDVSLVKVGDYVVENTAIESGLLAESGVTKNYTGVVDAGYDLYDIESDGKAVQNGYITAGKLIRWWDSGKKETTSQKQVGSWVSNNAFAYLEIDEKYDANTTFGISFRAREHVDNNESSYIRAQFNGTNTVKSEIGIGADWTTYSSNLKIDKAGDVLKVTIRRGVGCEDAPADIDDLIVWYDTDGDAVQDAGEKVIYSENFNAPDGNYIGTGIGKITTNEGGSTRVGKATVYHNFDETYAASETLTYENLNIESGVYTFTADLRIPYHDHMEMRNNDVDKVTTGFTWTATDGNAKTAQAYNDHTAEVKFILTRGTEETEKIVTVDVTNTWNPVTASVIVDEGCTLSKISVTPKFNSGANDIPAGLPLNFKNVNLVEGDPIKEEIKIEQETYENFLDNATEKRVNAFYESVTEGAEGTDTVYGYVTIGNLPIIWYPGKEWASIQPEFRLETDADIEESTYYSVSIAARKSVPVSTNRSHGIKVYFGNDDTIISGVGDWYLTDEFETKTYTVPSSDVSGKVRVYVRRGVSAEDAPIDIDYITIWKDVNSNGKIDGEETPIYNNDFNTPGDVGGLNASDGVYLAQNSDDYGRITPDLSNDPVVYPVIHYTDLKDDEGALHGEGTYIFSADMRVPNFYSEDLRGKVAEDETYKIDEYVAKSQYAVDVYFIQTSIDDSSKIETTKLEKTINAHWTSFESAVIVKPGYLLTDIKIEPKFNSRLTADEWVFDYKNVVLRHSDFPVIETEESENFLDGAKVTPDNLVSVEVIEDAPDGELVIGERPAANTNGFLKISLDETANADRTYYVGLKIRTTVSGQTLRMRPLVNVATDTVDANGVERTEINNNYLVPSSEGYLKPVFAPGNRDYFENDYTGDLSWEEWLPQNSYYVTTATNTEQYFVGMFSPEATSSTKLQIVFNVATGSGHVQPVAIDDIEVWYYDSNNDKVVIYSNNFNKEGDGTRGISGNGGAYPIEHVLPVTHTLYTPINPEETMSVTYELGLTVDEAVEGKYSFKTMVKLAEPTDKAAKARVIFNYSDGTSDVNYIDLTEDWSYIGKSDWLERTPDLVSITLEFDSDVPVMLVKPELTIFYKWTYGKPNSGILMVLLKKLQGKMVDPWKQVGVN